jgi:hypothetical protein
MLSNEIRRAVAPTHDVVIYIAGDYDRAREVCREFCDSGACVSVERTSYIYTGGEESGVAVRFINYPRFPSSEADLVARASDLAERLIVGLHQSSASVVGPTETVWLSRRAP